MRVRGVQMTTSSTARAHTAGENVRKGERGGESARPWADGGEGEREDREGREGREGLTPGGQPGAIDLGRAPWQVVEAVHVVAREELVHLYDTT